MWNIALTTMWGRGTGITWRFDIALSARQVLGAFES